MNNEEKDISRKLAPAQSARMVESIYGCKWSLTVYQLLANGINRPGAMVRTVDGLSTKVLNSCLRKNIEFGIIERIAYPEVPPRVEYVVTPFGNNFIRILDELEKLRTKLNRHNTVARNAAALAVASGQVLCNIVALICRNIVMISPGLTEI